MDLIQINELEKKKEKKKKNFTPFIVKNGIMLRLAMPRNIMRVDHTK